MLNIHSFLLGIKKRIRKSMDSCYKSSLLVVGYTLVAIIILLSSDVSEDKDRNVIEAYAKTEDLVGSFVGTHEETAKKANIRADQNPEDTIIQNESISDFYSMGAINGVVVSAIDQAYVDQQEKALEEQRARRLAADKKTRIETAKIEDTKEKEAKAKAAKKEVKNNGITLSASEREVLERIVEAEATGEDLKGRILVANVILNRVKSSKFPDTVKGVVFQRDGDSVQFSPTKDGRYWSVNVTSKTEQAIDKVLAGTDYSKGALYFSARSKADPSNMSWFDTHLTWLFRYKGHEFYK